MHLFVVGVLFCIIERYALIVFVMCPPSLAFSLSTLHCLSWVIVKSVACLVVLFVCVSGVG